jgi:hypothetical protein
MPMHHIPPAVSSTSFMFLKSSSLKIFFRRQELANVVRRVKERTDVVTKAANVMQKNVLIYKRNM